MNSHDSEGRFYLLVSRVLSGEASAGEMKELRSWMNEEPEYRKRFQKIRETWDEDPFVASDTSFLFDSEEGLKKVWRGVEQERTRADRKKTPPISLIPGSGQSRTPASIRSNKIDPFRIGMVGIHRQRHWFIAATILFVSVFLSVYAGYLYWEKPAEALYTTSSIEQRIITLPDESVVRLNRDSGIEILFDRGATNRVVRLRGEAFFDVAHDPDRLFLVQVGDSEIRVHGTAFNVKEQNGLMVAVQEGSVSIQHERLKSNRDARLNAGQLGILAPDGEDLKIEEGDLWNYLAWMNGYLSFDNMPFPQVVQQLERIFGIESELTDPALHKIRLSVYTNRMQTTEVLQTIALTLNLTYQQDGNVIRWKFAE